MPSDPKHASHFDTNRQWWDGVVPIHEASRGYDRPGFVRGEKPLCPVERAELGPLVSGKKLLHLQCHFGMDPLNWARLGAAVTGLDFYLPAIEAARRLSADSGIPGRFVQSNVYEAATAPGETFDICISARLPPAPVGTTPVLAVEDRIEATSRPGQYNRLTILLHSNTIKP